MTTVGIVITDPERFPAAPTMRDPAELLPALRSRGVQARAADWADPGVDWAGFDLVVLRSPWDYARRPAQFDAWLDRAGALTRILNDPALVRWNMDKRYLATLERVGIPGVPTSFHDEEASLLAALGAASDASGAGTVPVLEAADGPAAEPARVVLKPTVGAGAHQAGLFTASDPAALALGREILAADRTVMLQPEIPELSAGREKALYLIEGRFTHAIAKGALLAHGGGLRGGTYREAPEVVSAAGREVLFAEQVLAAVAQVTGLALPLYARIDLVDTAEHGLLLLEAELFEPLFNLQLVPAVTELFADAILARARSADVDPAHPGSRSHAGHESAALGPGA